MNNITIQRVLSLGSDIYYSVCNSVANVDLILERLKPVVLRFFDSTLTTFFNADSQLEKASNSKNFFLVNFWLKRGGEIARVSPQAMRNFAREAGSKGDLRMIKLLYEKNCYNSWDVINDKQLSILFPWTNDNQNIKDFFFKKAPYLFTTNEKDRKTTLAHKACEKEDVIGVLKILKEDPDQFSIQNEEGETAVHIACNTGNYKIISTILNAKPEFFKINDFYKERACIGSGFPPLYYLPINENYDKIIFETLEKDPKILFHEHFFSDMDPMPLKIYKNIKDKYTYVSKVFEKNAGYLLNIQCSPIFEAIAEKHKKVLDLILEKQPDLFLGGIHFSYLMSAGDYFPSFISSVLEQKPELLIKSDDLRMSALEHFVDGFSKGYHKKILFEILQTKPELFDTLDESSLKELILPFDQKEIFLMEFASRKPELLGEYKEEALKYLENLQKLLGKEGISLEEYKVKLLS